MRPGSDLISGAREPHADRQHQLSWDPLSFTSGAEEGAGGGRMSGVHGELLSQAVVWVGRWKRTELPGVSLSPGLRSAVRGRAFAQTGLSLEEKLEAERTPPYVQQSGRKSRGPRERG